MTRMIANTTATLAYDWPADCYVQGGPRWLERSTDPDRRAFVEAFPRNPNTFIRGEGESLEAAELAAWTKYQHYQACPGHEYKPRDYTNGAGFCIYCGMFASEVFTAEDLGLRCAVCGVFANYDREGDEFFCRDHSPRKEYMDRLMEGMKEVTDEDIATVLEHLAAKGDEAA